MIQLIAIPCNTRTQIANKVQCFRYIVSVPPTPLTQEDIWFQIGHVYEQQKDVSRQLVSKDFLLTYISMTMPRMLIAVCWNKIQIMPKSFSNLAGCITNKVAVLLVRKTRLSILRNLSARVSLITTMCPTLCTLTRGRSK
jgi:hypothetical protein